MIVKKLFASSIISRICLYRRHSKMSDQFKSVSTLSFADYDVYGFDIDHTLAKYNVPNLFTDSYLAMANYLVKKRGYSQEILSFRKDFFIRGLTLDMEKGNFLKLAQDGTVLRASHGTRFLTENEITSIYGSNKHWPLFETVIDSVDNIGEKCRIFENFFDMPIGVLCANVIDSVDKQCNGTSTKYKYWPDVIEAVNHIYHPKQYAADDGEFFPKWKRNTGHYVLPLTDNVKSWLKNLRDQGKKLFLLTSSGEDFASASLQFILGEDWRTYFDVAITLAKKPSFFSDERPFKTVTSDASVVSELEEGGCYQLGNSTTLTTFLKKITGKQDPKVLFFGDSLRADISSAKRIAGWDTVFVLEEIELELNDDGLSSENIDEPRAKRSKVVAYNEQDLEFLTSRQWGSLFTDDHLVADHEDDGKRYMNTMWGYIIRKYADIAIPDMESIATLPLDHQFPVFNHEQARTWGFYPRLPRALQQQDS